MKELRFEVVEVDVLPVRCILSGISYTVMQFPALAQTLLFRGIKGFAEKNCIV